MKDQELALIPRAGRDGKINYDLTRNGIVVASLVWTEWVGNKEGYRYCPVTTAQQFSRVLRPTVRETLMKAGRLKASVADKLIAEAPEFEHDGAPSP